jgi:hypothetical protein
MSVLASEWRERRAATAPNDGAIRKGETAQRQSETAVR